MASNQNLKDLQWLLQQLESQTIHIQNISFFLSHPTSTFHQHPQTSIQINISKENNHLFPLFLSKLSAMSTDNSNSVKNMEFHRVHWEVEYLQSFRTLLETNPDIDHIMFRRNGFGLDCLMEFSEILKRDCSVKGIVFCESSIGLKGAELIADALKVNESLEELQIWDDSIGLKGAEEISKMIEVNTSLKLLTVFDSSSLTAVPLISACLGRNRDIEQAVRAEGMKIKTFNDEGIKISVWNLAGQHELYSLHDLMFPGHGSASIFLVILSLFKKPNNKESKDPSEVEDDLHYWLRFIVTNSRRGLQQCILPNVTIVLTHFDKISQPSQNFQGVVDSIQRLRDKFHGFIEFYPTVFTVDARSLAAVSKIVQHIRNTGKVTLQRVPQVYEICNDLIQILSDWRSENNQKPFMSWKEFGELCQLKVPHLRVQSRSENKNKTDMRRRVIASCLHQIGEVIYFEDPGIFILDFVWFFDEVIGQLVRLNPRR